MWLEKAGVISGLERQVVYEMVVNDCLICKYILDFEYNENGVEVVEDVKGYATDVFKLKAKLFKALYPNIELRIIK